MDGRDSAAVGGWLVARSHVWRNRIQVVAIDPSAAFRKPSPTPCPTPGSRSTGSTWSQLANLMVTRVRQRLVRDRQRRRGRLVDPAWANRMLLLRGHDTLSARAKARLEWVFTVDDPTHELSAAWGVKDSCDGCSYQHGGTGPDREDDHGQLRVSR